MMQRNLTGLIHHSSSSPRSGTCFFDGAVGAFAGATDCDGPGHAEGGERERVIRLFEVVGIVCAVRRGSRMSRKSLSPLSFLSSITWLPFFFCAQGVN